MCGGDVVVEMEGWRRTDSEQSEGGGWSALGY